MLGQSSGSHSHLYGASSPACSLRWSGVISNRRHLAPTFLRGTLQSAPASRVAAGVERSERDTTMKNFFGTRIAHARLHSEPEKHIDYWPRDFSDPARLQGLSWLCDAIMEWCIRCGDSDAELLMIGSAVSHESFGRLFEHLEAELLKAAPPRTSPPCSAAGGGQPIYGSLDRRETLLHDLDVHVNLLRLLGQCVAGHFGLEPTDYENPWGSPAGTPWELTWEPADQEVFNFVHNYLADVERLHDKDLTPRHLRQAHERIASLARHAAQDLRNELRDPKAAIGLRTAKNAAAAKGDTRALAACTVFTTALRRAGTVLRQDIKWGSPHDHRTWKQIATAVRQAQRQYREDSLSLVARNRSDRQWRRGQLQRRLAIVGQYGFLVVGNSWRLEVSKTIKGLYQIAATIKELLGKLLGPLPEPRDELEFRAEVERLTVLATDTELVGEWRGVLGDDAGRCGALVEAIVTAPGGQSQPWHLKDKLKLLREKGVLDRKDQRGKLDQFTQLLYRMQEVGLAVQVPWDFVVGLSTKASARRLDHKGERWLVNPLGILLTKPEPATPARGKGKAKRAKAKKASASRSRPTKKAAATGVKKARGA